MSNVCDAALAIPSTAGTFTAGDGIATVSSRRGTFTPATWTTTTVAFSGAPSLAAVVAGDLIFHVTTGAWGVVRSVDDGTDTVTVWTWWAPITGRPNYLPSGTVASSVHIYPASYINTARKTRIHGVAVGGTSPTLSLLDAKGNALISLAAADAPTDLDLVIHGPWYVTTTGTNLTGSITWETGPDVRTAGPMTGCESGG